MQRLRLSSVVKGFGIVVLIVIALAVGACGGPSKAQTPGSVIRGPEGARTAPITPGSSSTIQARDFQITLYQGEDILGGKEVKFSELFAQGKPVVLNFWAGLCPPCRVEMPHLQQMHEAYKDRMLLFGLDVGPFVGLGSREDGQALLKQLKVTFPAGTTSDAEVIKAYGLVGMPTSIFFKPNGESVRKWTGILTKDQMVQMVEELLAASAKP